MPAYTRVVKHTDDHAIQSVESRAVLLRYFFLTHTEGGGCGQLKTFAREGVALFVGVRLQLNNL
jgi:hypothetical protein